MSTAFNQIRSLSLASAHVSNFDEQQVELFRPSSCSCGSQGASSSAATSMDDHTAPRTIAEPLIQSKRDISAWIEWAKAEALLHADLNHPRAYQSSGDESVASAFLKALVRRTSGRIMRSSRRSSADQSQRSGPDGSVASSDASKIQHQLLPLPLSCSHDVLMEKLGCGVRLYFDLLLFFFGMSIVGIMCALPSLTASLLYPAAYPDADLMEFPAAPFALMTLGARVSRYDAVHNEMVPGCTSDECKLLNLLTALLDVAYCLLLWFAVREFESYARHLAEFDTQVIASKIAVRCLSRV